MRDSYPHAGTLFFLLAILTAKRLRLPFPGDTLHGAGNVPPGSGTLRNFFPFTNGIN